MITPPPGHVTGYRTNVLELIDQASHQLEHIDQEKPEWPLKARSSGQDGADAAE